MNAPLDLPSGVRLSEETADPRIEISTEAKSFLIHLRRRNQILVFEGTSEASAKNLFTRRRREMRTQVRQAQLKKLTDPMFPTMDLLAWMPEQDWEKGEYFYLFRDTVTLRLALSLLPRGAHPRIWISYLEASRTSVRPVFVVKTGISLLGYQTKLHLEPTG